MTKMLEIVHDPEMPEGGEYYIFEDVAELFWPGDYSRGNHAVEESVTVEIVQPERGAKHVPGTYAAYETPRGLVVFDSESGCFEVHSSSREAVEWVRDVILELKSEKEVELA